MAKKVVPDSIEKSMGLLNKRLSSLDARFDRMEERMDAMIRAVQSSSLAPGVIAAQKARAKTERIVVKAERNYEHTEQPDERSEQSERPLRFDRIAGLSTPRMDGFESFSQIQKTARIEDIRGRHREILAMLINGGFHTYKDMADKLNVSQSRVRAYIAELRNKYQIPLKQIRDAEGYKIGVEMRFIEEILASK